MGIVRDTWRAVLVLVVGAILIEAADVRQPAPPPTVATPAWVPPQPQMFVQQPQPERPLRRVASAVMEFGDSVIGVFR